MSAGSSQSVAHKHFRTRAGNGNVLCAVKIDEEDQAMGFEIAKEKGRPSLYNEALADSICDRLADGESLNSICKSETMPSERTVRTWARTPDHAFSPKYAQARQIGYLKLADELLEIADDGTNDWMKRFGKDGEGWAVNGEHIARSRLRVDTRKWLLSKCLPKVFGDRITTEHTGPNAGPVPVIHSGMTVKEAAAAYEQAIKGIGDEFE